MSISKESSNTTRLDGQGEDNSNSKDLEYGEMASPQYHGRKKWHRKPHMVAGTANLTHQRIVPHGMRHAFWGLGHESYPQPPSIALQQQVGNR